MAISRRTPPPPSLSYTIVAASVRWRHSPSSYVVCHHHLQPAAVLRVVRCHRCLPLSSVTYVYSVQKAEDIAKHLPRPGSPTIPLFDPERWYPIPRYPFSSDQNHATHIRKHFHIADFHIL